MSVYETTGQGQKQALLALHHTHEAVLDVMKPVLSRTEPVVRIMRELPYVDQLPTVREGVDQWFGFFEDVLKEEKEFLLHVTALVPTHVAHRAVRSTAKAA